MPPMEDMLHPKLYARPNGYALRATPYPLRATRTCFATQTGRSPCPTPIWAIPWPDQAEAREEPRFEPECCHFATMHYGRVAARRDALVARSAEVVA